MKRTGIVRLMDQLSRRLIGMKIERWGEWQEILNDEIRAQKPLDLALSLIMATLTWGRASKSLWRGRMRDCARCPVYDRSQRKCRPYAASPLGCGCYMPFKLMSRSATCWAQDHLPDSGLGFRQ